MRNTQQKVIAIFYLLIVIGLSFFAPLYSRSSNYLDFGPIWTNKIDWFKFGYIFFLISLFFILLFYFYRNKPRTDFNSPTFKRKVKRELKVFVFGVLAFGLFLGFIEGFNLYQENRKDKIEKKIDELELSLVEYEIEMDEGNQKKYYEYLQTKDVDVAPTYESFEATMQDDGNRKKYYEYLQTKDVDVAPTYESFSSTLVKKVQSKPSSTDSEEVAELLTVSEFSAKIKAKYPEYKEWDDLVLAKKIIEKYPEYKDNVVFDDEIKENTKKINQLNSERDKLFFIKGYYYQSWLLVFGLAELFLLYVFRFSFYGVRSLTNYLKEE